MMSDLYGSMVFDDKVMSKRLPKETYRELKRCCALDLPLSRDMANIIANEMKEWAVEKGVTHFTHWFQPLRHHCRKARLFHRTHQRRRCNNGA